jgi:hypothetical protein
VALAVAGALVGKIHGGGDAASAADALPGAVPSGPGIPGGDALVLWHRLQGVVLRNLAIFL